MSTELWTGSTAIGSRVCGPSLNVGRSTLDGRTRLEHEGVSFSFNLGRWLGFRWLGFKMPNLYGRSNLGRSSKI
jgi:hypothetical protein